MYLKKLSNEYVQQVQVFFMQRLFVDVELLLKGKFISLNQITIQKHWICLNYLERQVVNTSLGILNRIINREPSAIEPKW